MVMNPPDLRHSLEFVASSFYSTLLMPVGVLGHETTMVVISNSSWSEILRDGGV